MGAAGFEIAGPSHRILVDPFLTGNPLAPCGPDDLPAPDVILVSHAAFDHLGDTAAIARRTGAPVVCGADVRLLLLEAGLPPHQIRATVWGIVVEVGGVRVRPVECRHWSHAMLRSGVPVTGTPLAFIVETEPGVRVYHYGDTAVFDMGLIGRLYRPTVGLIGCTDPAEIDDAEAAGRLLTGELSPTRPRWSPRCSASTSPWRATTSAATPTSTPSSRPFRGTTWSGRRAVLAPDVGDVIIIDGAPREATIAAAAPAR